MSSSYPEHEKLKAIKDKSQAIGEFLEWVQHKKGWVLAEKHEHSDDCYDQDPETQDYVRLCDMRRGEYLPAFTNTQDLLAEFFDIDRKKLSDEKNQMLEEMRKEANG